MKTKESKVRKKSSKGITLIALIVTIIVLIIIAGISINLIFGENGVVKKAKYAKEKYENGANQEQKDLEEIYGQLLVATDGTISNISLETLQELINKTVDAKIASGTANPVGTVISYITGENAPDGYLKCDGTVYNISEYKALADAIKNGLGSYNYYGGDGTTTFAVPNLQGEFLRGTGINSHEDGGEGSEVGTHQAPTLTPYMWVYSNGTNGALVGETNGRESNSLENGDAWKTVTPRYHFDLRASMGVDSGLRRSYKFTSRPTNTSVLYCIKY